MEELNSNLYLRKATQQDKDRIWVILQQAVAQMLREGKHQWDETYPRPENIQADLDAGVAYVLCQGKDLTVDTFNSEIEDPANIIAYAAVVYDGEPAYSQPQLEWISNPDKFVVVHRIAVADECKRRGIATTMMRMIEKMAAEEGYHSFRIDTNYDNFYMQKMLSTLGFTFTGKCFYQRCGERLCYEKVI